jgi:predicted MPP superfamily phosphohydrolase
MTQSENSPAPPTTHRFSRRALLQIAATALATGTAVEAFALEPHRLIFQTVEVPIQGLPDAFDGYRISLLSDFHFPLWSSAETIRQAVALANAFQPDLMTLPGDFVDKRVKTIPSLSGLFDAARAKDGIVGTLGNHDHLADAAGVRRAIADQTPIRLIDNQALIVERGGHALAVGGVGDLWEGIVMPERAFAHIAPETPRILLSHNPDLAEEMSVKIRVDLQLSGHTHGGGVCLPGGIAPILPSLYGQKYRAGLVQGRSHRVYVTRGVCSVWHNRLFCPPEVTGITLRKMRSA